MSLKVYFFFSPLGAHLLSLVDFLWNPHVWFRIGSYTLPSPTCGLASPSYVFPYGPGSSSL